VPESTPTLKIEGRSPPQGTPVGIRPPTAARFSQQRRRQWTSVYCSTPIASQRGNRGDSVPRIPAQRIRLLRISSGCITRLPLRRNIRRTPLARALRYFVRSRAAQLSTPSTSAASGRSRDGSSCSCDRAYRAAAVPPRLQVVKLPRSIRPGQKVKLPKVVTTRQEVKLPKVDPPRPASAGAGTATFRSHINVSPGAAAGRGW